MDKIYRPTKVTIDLSAIIHNLGVVKKLVGREVKILAVVKSDAYGHGMLRVCGHLKEKIDFFGVASIDEAILLRKAKIKKPILIFENSFCVYAKEIIDYDITPTVCSLDLAHSLNKQALKKGKRINVHIKVDTGMGRLGIWHKEALDFIRKIKKFSHLNIEGLYTHFPCADTNVSFTQKQIAYFKNLIDELRRAQIHIPICHAANSMGIIGYKESHFDMVRAGLMIYGLYPKDGLETSLKLKPALSLKSRIIFLKKTPRGRTISYGGTFTTSKPTFIATIPVGYNDGYFRNLSNKSQVIIKGKLCKIVGRVCMDQLMADCLDAPVKLGDVVTLIGRGNDCAVSVEELSALAGTIPYEIACSIGKSSPRFYIS